MELVNFEKNLPIDLADIKNVKRLISQQVAPGTRRVYVSDFKIFTKWCEEHKIDPKDAPPEMVAVFLANQYEQRIHPSTLVRRLAAIRFAYKAMNKPTPTDTDIVKATMRGIKRDEKAPVTKHKNPLTNEILINLMQHIPLNTLRGIRDRAIMLLLFGGAFRRSEIINVQYENLSFVENGLDITLWHSKTNQEGRQQIKSIVKGRIFCPVTAVKTWIERAQILDGYLFRALTRTHRVTTKPMCENSIYYLVKFYSQKAGYDFTHFSPHSLRAGFSTSAAEHGKNIFKVMDVTLHASMESLKPYIKFAERYKDHPGEGLL